MNFAYPSFLWALLALAIPIIVHLFNFRKAKKIYFSNVKFLENVKQKSSSKLKLKHLLVLASRLLFITMLVLTFAQPFIPGNETGLNKNAVTIYLDNSQSMSNRTDSDLTGLDAGIVYLEQIIKLYSQETKFRIITNDFSPNSINSKSQERALELSTELGLSNLTRNFPEVFRKINGHGDQDQDVYIISDFQKSTFGLSQGGVEDSINDYKVIPIKYLAKNNVFIDSVFLENPFLISGQVNRLHVKVRNIGTSDANDVILKLFVNGQQAATASVDVDKNSVTTTSLDLNFQLEDINECRISFEDFPLTFDNDHYFVLNTLKRINVVEILGNSETKYIESVFADQSLFDFQRFTYGGIDYNKLASSDLVIINQHPKIDANVNSLINDLLAQGKSVLFVPAQSMEGDLQTTVGPLPVVKLTGTDWMDLDRPDISNPFYNGIFEDVDNKTTMPRGKPVLYWAQQGSHLLRLKNGFPFLSAVESTGTLYIMSSPMTDDHTNFHKHALFVPILYRMAALSSYNYFPLSYSMNSPAFSIDVDTVVTDGLFKLKKEGEEFIPEQHFVGNSLSMDLPRYLLNPGFYDLVAGTATENTIAFNNAKTESQPDQMNTQELTTLFSGIQNLEIIDIDDVQAFTSQMKERYEGLQLWKYALVLCLLFLLAETLLIRFL